MAASPPNNTNSWRERLRRALKQTFRWAVRLRGSHHAVAWGVAIGLVVAFSPTIGIQMFIAAGIAHLFGASKPAAIVPVWITNPLTIAPIYAFTYYAGTFFYPGPSASAVYDTLTGIAKSLGTMQFYQFVDQFKAFFNIGWDVFIPMCIGGLIVGGVAGAISYPITLWVMQWFNDFRHHRKQKRRLRMEERRIRKATASAA